MRGMRTECAEYMMNADTFLLIAVNKTHKGIQANILVEFILLPVASSAENMRDNDSGSE